MTRTEATNGISSGTRPATKDVRGPIKRTRCTGPPASASSADAADSNKRTILEVEVPFTFFHPLVIIDKDIQCLRILLLDLIDLAVDERL